MTVHPDDLDDRIALYESVLGVSCDARMPMPEAGLELATVGNVLLIGNPGTPGEAARTTAFTLLVASVPDHVAALERAGAVVPEPVATTPAGPAGAGAAARRHAVELIDHRPLPEERG